MSRLSRRSGLKPGLADKACRRLRSSKLVPAVRTTVTAIPATSTMERVLCLPRTASTVEVFRACSGPMWMLAKAGRVAHNAATKAETPKANARTGAPITVSANRGMSCGAIRRISGNPAHANRIP